MRSVLKIVSVVYSMPCQQGLEYTVCIPYKEVGLPKKGVSWIQH